MLLILPIYIYVPSARGLWRSFKFAHCHDCTRLIKEKSHFIFHGYIDTAVCTPMCIIIIVTPHEYYIDFLPLTLMRLLSQGLPHQLCTLHLLSNSRGVGTATATTATATTAMAVPLFRLTPWHIIALEQKTTVVLASLVMTSTLCRKMTWHSSGTDRDCIIICVEKGVASRVIRVCV